VITIRIGKHNTCITFFVVINEDLKALAPELMDCWIHVVILYTCIMDAIAGHGKKILVLNLQAELCIEFLPQIIPLNRGVVNLLS